MRFYHLACFVVGAGYVCATPPPPGTHHAESDPWANWQPLQVPESVSFRNTLLDPPRGSPWALYWLDDWIQVPGAVVFRDTLREPGSISDLTANRRGPSVLETPEYPSYISAELRSPVRQSVASFSSMDGLTSDDVIGHYGYTMPPQLRTDAPEPHIRGDGADAGGDSSSVSLDTESLQLSPGSIVPLKMDSKTSSVCSECLRQVSAGGTFALACNQHAVHSCMKRFHDSAQSKNKSLRCPLCTSGSQPVLRPRGVFTGAGLDERIIMTATFSSMSVDLVFNVDGTVLEVDGTVKYTVAGIPYTMNGLSAELGQGHALEMLRGLLDHFRDVLDHFASRFAPPHISIEYIPSADQISCSLNGQRFTGTRVV